MRWCMEAYILMSIFLIGLMLGLSIGYPFGLFIDHLDKRTKNSGR